MSHKCKVRKSRETGAWTVSCRGCANGLQDFFGIPSVIGTKATFDGAVRRAVAHHKRKSRPKVSAVIGGYVPRTPLGQETVIEKP